MTWNVMSNMQRQPAHLSFHDDKISRDYPPPHPWEFPLYHLASDVQLITQRGRLCNCLHMHLLQLNILSNVDTEE